MDEIRIGNARVDFTNLAIDGDAGRFSVEPKVLEVLRALVDQHGKVVDRESLIDKVWGVGFGETNGFHAPSRFCARRWATRLENRNISKPCLRADIVWSPKLKLTNRMRQFQKTN